ncbi:ATP-binding protein [Saccharopolyspora sp. HNM0983]|uniref:histidine kinase n=1 Tax=Saccharopolyspora montiporae TaxID=2781240 RepID=A0A929BDQ4_9PSEU|nr:ATP-binding protein [Saccharopolyspora sp. HNM0983]MBE9376480.1 ATP-binding protein [Saccharopolyspora sp. HNM0983]
MTDHALTPPAPAPVPGRPAGIAALITALVTGAAAATAVLTTPPGAQQPVAWIAVGAAVLLCLLVPLAVRGALSARVQRARADAAEQHAAEQARRAVADAEQRAQAQVAAVRTEHETLVNETLPALVQRLRDGRSAQTVLAETDPSAHAGHQDLVELVVAELGHSERGRTAALAACANAAGRVQALATGMLAELRDMQRRHGDSEKVLGDLFELDHRTSRIGRVADGLAVLTGARSGRPWPTPIPMESILRGAVGRIDAYRRIKLHSNADVAVVSHAAEGVMRALAELMDNAARFSPPKESAYVYTEEGHRGLVVTIEDGGLGMKEPVLERAVQAVGPDPLDLTTLAGTRLGLAVVGCLARKHGLTVSFRPSSRGGTGVVVLIPRDLLTDPPRDEPVEDPPSPVESGIRDSGTPATPARSAESWTSGTLPTPETASPTATADPAVPEQPGAGRHSAEQPATGDSATGGLPRRRRGRTLEQAHPHEPGSSPGPDRPNRTRPDPGRMGSFRNSVTRRDIAASDVDDGSGA